MPTKTPEQPIRDRQFKPEAPPSGMIEVEPGLYVTRKSTSVFTPEDDDDEDSGVQDSPHDTVKK